MEKKDKNVSTMAGQVLAIILAVCVIACIVALTVKFVWWILFAL